MDPELVEKIVHEVKSQGLFDEFRKDLIADVDTKPAYQNLRQRVDNAVHKFLSSTRWTPEMNKNQLREKLRRHVAESGFLDVGVERIVDQVVNPKIGTSFQPRIEEIAYSILGLPLPVKTPEKAEYTTQPFMPPLPSSLPPLPSGALTIQTSNLLPTDLEQVSPDSDASNTKSEVLDDDEESPPFEPLTFEPLIAHKKEGQEISIEQNMELSNTPSPPPLPPLPPPPPPPNDPPPPGVDELPPPPPLPPMPKSPPQPPPAPLPEVEITSTPKEENMNKENLLDVPQKEENLFTEIAAIACTKLTCEKKTFDIMAAMSSHDSQLSQVSTDSHLSINDFNDVKTPHSPSEATTANISEEAQMPKFNENSLETSNDVTVEPNPKEFHFDIKKDEIKFEGTERKNSFSCNQNVNELNEKPEQEQQEQQVEETQKEEVQTEANIEKKDDKEHHNASIGSNTSSELSVEPVKEQERESTPTQTTAESNFYSSINDSSSAQLCIVDDNEGSVLNEDSATQSNSIVLLPQATSSPSPPLTHKNITTTTNDSPTTTMGVSDDVKKAEKMKKDKLLESIRNKKYSKDKTRHGDEMNNSKNNRDHHKKDNKTDKDKSSRNHNIKDENTKHNSKHSSDKSNRSSRSSSHKSKRSENQSKRHEESTLSKSNKKKTREKSKQHDDHYLSKERVIRQKSPDSNDDEDNNNGGSNNHASDATNNGDSSTKMYLADGEKSTTTTNGTNNNNEKADNEQEESCETVHAIVAKDNVGNQEGNKKQKKIIFLNDILQNSGIEFDTRKQSVDRLTNTQYDLNLRCNIEKSIIQEDDYGDEPCAELEYFMENDIKNIVERLKLLDNVIKLCKSSYLQYEVNDPDEEEYADAKANNNDNNKQNIEQGENTKIQENDLKNNHIITRKRYRNTAHMNMPSTNEQQIEVDISGSIILTNDKNANSEEDDNNNNDNAFDKNHNGNGREAELSEEEEDATKLHCFIKRKKIMEESIVFSTFSKFNFNAKENNLLATNTALGVSSCQQKSANTKINNRKSIEKQRYKSDDLYKPRSTIRSSRRRLSIL